MEHCVEFWLHENFFKKEEILKINDYIENNYDSIEETQNTAHDLDGNSKKQTKTLILRQGKIIDLIQKIIPCIEYINNIYFGYDLYPFNEYQNCFYNIYDANRSGSYGWHIDTSRSDVHDMKLTVLLNLSTEDYSGGVFSYFNGNEYKIPGFQKPGSVLIFKSYLNHQVTPVTLGKRKTLTLFTYGPKMK
jgi:PKHD-type hydroxylase|tara:strand:+ start:126 stop:695 length:570 start_codon:yes stop_codon:yes gene_type:complete